MATERFSIGPFAFTFSKGRLWARYTQRNYGDRLRFSLKPISADMTLAMRLRRFLDTGETRRAGLVDFVRWYMGDVPGAVHHAETQEQVALAMPRFSFAKGAR